jgi:hypothetical protein
MKHSKRDRVARIETEARRLARSGRFLSSRSIEQALLAEGFPEAHQVFRNLWTHSELNRLCEQAARRAADTLKLAAA